MSLKRLVRQVVLFIRILKLQCHGKHCLRVDTVHKVVVVSTTFRLSSCRIVCTFLVLPFPRSECSQHFPVSGLICSLYRL